MFRKVVPLLLLCSSCIATGPELPDEAHGSLITFGARGLTAELSTKAAIVNELSSFYVSATAGAPGTESLIFESAVFTRHGDVWTSDDVFWPQSRPAGGINFYASNVPLFHATSSAGVVVCATPTAGTDVVSAILHGATFREQNTLEFGHILAGIGNVTVTAPPGWTLSDVRMSLLAARPARMLLDGIIVSESGSTLYSTLASDNGSTNAANLFIPPGDYSPELHFTISNGMQTLSTSEYSPYRPDKPIRLESGKLKHLEVEADPYPLMPLTLEITQGGKIAVAWVSEAGYASFPAVTGIRGYELVYSVNSGAWQTALFYNGSGNTRYSSVIDVSAGDVLQFRSNGVSGWTMANSQYLHHLSFNYDDRSSAQFRACGNLRSLILEDFLSGTVPASWSYYSNAGLFAGSKVTDASRLVLLTPGQNGSRVDDTYYQGCARMFEGCTSLVAPPKLSYRHGPNFRYMFKGCTSLREAPAMEWTEYHAGKSMFREMFSGCSSLERIKALWFTDSASEQDWVRGVGNNGTIILSENVLAPLAGNNGVPIGWNVQKVALPGDVYQ